jgi:hypothetical protein
MTKHQAGLFVELSGAERTALTELARMERREESKQAAVILHNELSRIGLLETYDNDKQPVRDENIRLYLVRIIYLLEKIAGLRND